MRVDEEFKVQSKAGHTLILQKIGLGITYLDFGNTHLPHDFQGYKVKYSDHVAEPLNDGSFKIKDTGEVVRRLS
ncbi:MAG TPA: hypothetical protein VN028_07135 [Rhodocyclaceae bacterium]|nr:hypothetical protein [Rhodocyclaceae bacterium]